MASLKRIFFPKIPARPPTKKEVEQRRKEFVKRFVSAHAEGNVTLARGHFRTK